MPKGVTLSIKERRFVDAFLGSCSGNATHAAREAGYSPKTAGSKGSQLLKKVNVAAVVKARTAKAETKSIADAAERDQILSDVARSSGEETHARISAIKELNKCSGRHSIKHVLDVTEKLSDIIAGSRSPA